MLLWCGVADGQSPAVLGQTILVNNTPLTIVGVNPKGFTSAEDVQSSDDVFVPLSMQAILSPMPGKVQPLFDVIRRQMSRASEEHGDKDMAATYFASAPAGKGSR